MLGGASFEVEVTNVGVVEMGDVDTGPLHATAVWGPAILNQISGEIVLGVITSGGQLWMTASAHTDVGPFLGRLHGVVERVDG